MHTSPDPQAARADSSVKDGQQTSRRTWLKLTGMGALSAGGAVVGVGGTYAFLAPGLTHLTPTARVAPRFEHGAGDISAQVRFRFPNRTVGEAEHHCFALTFDDGPDPKWTPIVLDLLAKYEAKATFFMMGPAANEHRAIVSRLLREGHEVAVHAWKHVDVYRYDYRELQRLTGDVVAALMAAGAPHPRWWRPPYGRVDAPALALAAEAGFGIVLWSHHMPGDNYVERTEQLIAQVEAGAVVLSHDGRTSPNDALMAATDQLLAGTKRRGLRSVTISQLQALTTAPTG